MTKSLNIAIEFGAVGVHLGQSDISIADIPKIEAARLHLGFSSHNLYEFFRPMSYSPCYVAYGPIYETSCNSMVIGEREFECFERVRIFLS